MLLNASRTRPFNVCLHARASSSSFPLKYDIPYSPIVETVRKRIAITHGLKSGVLSDAHVDVYNSTLMRIRQAIKDKNAAAIIDYWQHLERNNLLHFLGAVQIEKISELLTVNFMSNDRSLANWDTTTQDIIHDIAFRVAAFCCTDALATVMLLFIKHKEPDTVIRLYEKFITSLGADICEETGTKKLDDSMADLHPRSNSPPFHPGRISVLLAVTTAHAMNDSFQEALNTWITTTTRLSSFSVASFLMKLEHAPAIKQKVQAWIPRLDIAVQVSRPSILSRRIVKLAEKQSSDGIEKLYGAMVDGLTGPDAFIAVHPTASRPTKKIVVNSVIWGSFLSGFMKCRRRDLASKLWDHMIGLGIKPDVALWTVLIDAYDSMQAVDDALASWNMMRTENIKPNALAYRAVISALFNGRKPDVAMRIFREYQREDQSIRSQDPEHQLSVWNTVLNGLLRAHRVQEAKDLLRNMPKTGVTPDIVSYNTFLGYYGRRGHFRELADVVNDMADTNLAGDVFSFSTILSALLKAGRTDAPDIIFKLMQKQGIEPNVAAYTAIIDHQMRGDSKENVRAALLMLQRMELDRRIYPNEVTYTSLLAGLHRNQELSLDKIQELVKDVTQRMKERNIQLGLPAYHILLKACLINSQPEGLQNAMGYYNEMISRRIPMVPTTWYILLAGLLHREEWKVADEVVKDMFKTGMQPAGSVLELVSRIRKRLV
ncbi:hypothetical protein APHAL10511_006137 [Amanita phalloides]|nr:hypothetical protein APHAL10511_006137 [Amanita phalloides]